ncbi:MDR family MFS transporter [Herbiconiux ginsengi]|uniref:Drug resistance transporter, EmrB/QacA subfamily n=1 Tax=Herbiconiux ginsengi TaxID=381665 RepID=A0A1H3QKK9_9MICO|nr:MDR family MFS transporter [Herbiconiux ginsengi]SDZ14124.1 drug resistance transporter, EmrB/QacA subfamily [Herbiconiux ginsengi]
MTVVDGVGFRSKRGPILIALMVTTGLVAIEATILATAVPSIVKDLGGFAQFPWLFSIYLLSQAVSVPIYAKLSDTVGRKPIILIGIALFMVGSILCGFAWSMPALIAFRALQGLGAGAVQPMALTIAGDIYTVAERAKTQGYLASVWAVSSVIGPTLGGLFSEFVSWRWIFFVNVPICILAGWMLIRRFHETIEKRHHRIDYPGAILLTVGMSAIILAFLEGGQAWEWVSPESIGAFALGAIALIAFYFVEKRAAEPIIPMWIFSRRLLVTTTLLGLGVGVMLIGLTSYIPTYLEGSIGASPLVSGLALAALTIGWPVSASVSGRLYFRIGFRGTVLIGLTLAVLGTLALTLSASSPSIPLVAVCCFVIGFGFGWVAAPSLIAAQSSVSWSDRGVVTGTSLFARSIGSAVGVAVFGAIANAILAGASGGEHDPTAIVAASGAVFTAVAVCAVLTVTAGLLMPRSRVEDVELVATRE